MNLIPNLQPCAELAESLPALLFNNLKSPSPEGYKAGARLHFLKSTESLRAGFSSLTS